MCSAAGGVGERLSARRHERLACIKLSACVTKVRCCVLLWGSQTPVWRESECKISCTSVFPCRTKSGQVEHKAFPREALKERRCLGAPSLSALLFFHLITKSVTQTPWKPQWTQKPSLTSACGSCQGHRGGVIMVCQSKWGGAVMGVFAAFPHSQRWVGKVADTGMITGRIENSR